MRQIRFMRATFVPAQNVKYITPSAVATGCPTSSHVYCLIYSHFVHIRCIFSCCHCRRQRCCSRRRSRIFTLLSIQHKMGRMIYRK